MDYIKYDGAPDPLKFLNKEKTYIGFVAKMEKDDALKKLLDDEDFLKNLKNLSGKLPIKRIYEFSIIKYLLNHEEITLDEAKNEILKYIENVDDESIIHAFQCLNQNYYDSAQIKNNIKCFELMVIVLSVHGILKINKNKKYRIYIEDIINYGLIRYEKEFGSKYYGVPFFKLYEQYQMVDAALFSNYTKIHSSFRGSGLITNGKEYFIFIDLHKEEDIKESINYKDKFIDRIFNGKHQILHLKVQKEEKILYLIKKEGLIYICLLESIKKLMECPALYLYR